MRSRRPSSEQDARLIDAVVAPRFDARFARGILDALPHGDRVTVLELGCSTGRLASAMLRRLGTGGRVVAVDEDEGLVDLAQRRAFEDVGKRLFFKIEGADHLSFGNDVFDAVVGNLVWEGLEAPELALCEVRRVLVPDGALHMTTPLRGSFAEVHDMIREHARASGDGMMAARLDAHERQAPTERGWREPFATAGFTRAEVYVNEWKLSYDSAGALFEDPMLQMVAVPKWRGILGQDGLAAIQRRMDVYAAGGPVSLTVRAGRILAS